MWEPRHLTPLWASTACYLTLPLLNVTSICSAFILPTDMSCLLYTLAATLYSATVSGQRLRKHVPAVTNTHAIIKLLLETGFSVCGPCRNVKTRTAGAMSSSPCGGGIEYLHRDPASRRRWKGKSRIWDSKIWPRVLRDSDPKITALARASCNCEQQIRPLVREGAPNKKTRNCQTVIKIWLWAPDVCFIPRQTGRLDSGSLYDSDSVSSVVSSTSQRTTALAQKLKNLHCSEQLPSND
jgi:hypothetical protein